MNKANNMRTIFLRFSGDTTTTNAVLAALRHSIIEGVLRPGERLLSDNLAGWFGVSRTPVREALRKLEAEGYVSTSAGKGLVVREYSEKDLEEIFFIRELLEGAATRLAAENASSQDLDRIGEVLEDMEIAYKRGNADVFRKLSGEFHSLVHRASRNVHLATILQDLQESVRRFSVSTLSTPGRMIGALEEHRALFDALKARDGNKAENLARQHRQKTLAMRRQMIRAQLRQDADKETYSPPPPNRSDSREL